MEEEILFGISLGNCTASIAYSKDTKTEVLADKAGERATPTLVSYRDGEEVVGKAAKQGLHRNSSNTVDHMIHLIGNDVDDDDDDKERLAGQLTYGISRDSDDCSVCYILKDDKKEKSIPVTNSLTLILKSLHETAESFSGAAPSRVVVGVPSHFTSHHKTAVRRCCEDAGFEVMRVITEATAVCLAHSIGQKNKNERSYVLVYNLGGHTVSLSLVLVSGGMYCDIATRYITSNVGGSLIDKIIVNFLTSEFEKQHKVSIHGNKKCYFKLLAAAESAKITLSTGRTASVHVESLYDGLDFIYSLSRGRFEGLCSSVFQHCVNSEIISQLLEEGGVARGDVKKVIMAGGSCKIPRIHTLLETQFPNSEILVTSPLPEEAVAIGCSLQARLMGERWRERKERDDEGIEILCVPHDLVVKGSDISDKLLVESLTPIPCSVSLSLPLPPSQTEPLQLWQMSSSSSYNREIARLPVPDSLGSIDVALSWTTDNVITMTTTNKDSDWSSTISLSCEL